MPKLEVNLDLIRKYDVPGPRYTSYPTAPHFSEEINWDKIVPMIRSNNSDSDKPLSLYFHLPFCRSLCWFCGCTNVITQDPGSSKLYLKYLRKELDLVTPLMDPKRKAVQLHFGGGSPSFLSAEEILTLGGWIHHHFPFAETYEAGVEVDPRTVTEEKMKAFASVGFNRISIGIQDLDPDVQQTIHRVQPHEMNLRTLDWARSNGIQSVNVDLIYGLPHQTTAGFEHTLDEILKMRPDRFAVFNYAHVPWLKKAQAVLTPLLPERKMDLLKMTIEKLTSSGYTYIGMDHFALENDELAQAQKNKTLQRNFQGYSTHAGSDIYAFGMSSISQTDSAYWQNEKDLKQYYSLLDADHPVQRKGYILSEDDKIRHQTIMRLMCDLELDYAEMSRKLGIDFESYFAEELSSLQDMETDQLICRDKNGFKVTDTGRLLIRNIAMKFDVYLKTDKQRKYSRTV